MVDVATGLARALFAAVGAGRPIRLFCGISCSLILKTIIHVCASVNPESVFWKVIDELSVYWWVVIVVPLFFAPLVFFRRGAMEGVATQVNDLDLLLARGKFSPAQCRMVWHSLIDRYVKAASPDLSKKPDLPALISETLDEAGIRPGSDPTANG